MLTRKQLKPERPVPLSCEKLASLPTPRLLAYKKALYRVTPNRGEDWIWDCACTTCKAAVARRHDWYYHLDAVKAILATREHVVRNRRTRHTNH